MKLQTVLAYCVTEFFKPSVSVGHILLFCVLTTSLNAVDLIPSGLSMSSLQYFFSWPFSHLSNAHAFMNMLFLVLVRRCGVRMSLANISVISLYALVLTTLSPLPFYGASGLWLFIYGACLRDGRLFRSYPIAATCPVLRDYRLPYLLPVIIAVMVLYANSGASFISDSLHLFSFAYGARVFDLGFLGRWFQRGSRSALA